MNNKYDILIKEFEANIIKLISENDELKVENNSLMAELERKQQDLRQAHKELLDLSTAYNNLLSTNVLNGTKEERQKFRQFLEEVVIEIDKSLELIK